MGTSLTEYSKLNWVLNEEELPTNEQLIVGCLQRIATATELMSRNYDNLIHDVNFYKKRCEEKDFTIQKLRRSNAALRGHLGKKKY